MRSFYLRVCPPMDYLALYTVGSDSFVVELGGIIGPEDDPPEVRPIENE